MVIIKTTTSNFGPIPTDSNTPQELCLVIKLVFSVQDEELDQWGVC